MTDRGDSPALPGPVNRNGRTLRTLEVEVSRWLATGNLLVSTLPLPLVQGETWPIVLGSAIQFMGVRVIPESGENQPQRFFRLSVNQDVPSVEPMPVQEDERIHEFFLTQWCRRPDWTVLWRFRKQAHARVWTLQGGSWRILPLSDVLADSLYECRIRPALRRLVPALKINEPDCVDRLHRFMRRLTCGKDGEPTRSAKLTWSDAARWAEFIQADHSRARTAGPTQVARRITLYIGSLSPGGAERQFCNLAIGLHQRGHHVKALTAYPTEGDGGHYTALLQEQGIEVQTAVPDLSLTTQEAARVRWDLLSTIPGSVRMHTTNLATALATDPPDILHAWLDHPNIIAGLAGLALCNVPCPPAILLSTRNANPTNFPRLHAQYMQEWYRILSGSRRVHWLANSHGGAESYAKWIGMDLHRHHVVLNGLFADHFTRPTPQSRAEARTRLGLCQARPVVAVINRLSEEKQPELMLKVISILRHDIPDVLVLVAGQGPLESRLRSAIGRRGLDRTVRLLGRVEDVTTLLCASDILLLTSTLEGCPNVVLEAQHVGVPVVATAGGGTVDTILDGQTGFLCPITDAVQLTRCVRRVLTDAGLRDALGTAAQKFVDASFSVDQMVDLTCRVYDLMLDPDFDPLDQRAVDRRIQTPRPRHEEHTGVRNESRSLAEVMIRRILPSDLPARSRAASVAS